jgi:hypothetical protein
MSMGISSLRGVRGEGRSPVAAEDVTCLVTAHERESGMKRIVDIVPASPGWYARWRFTPERTGLSTFPARSAAVKSRRPGDRY